MIKNKFANRPNKNKKGFTYLELLIIISIISILVIAGMVSMINAKYRAQDNSAFSSFKTLAAPAFVCLGSGVPGVRITQLAAGNNICSTASATPGSVWPNFSKYGWDTFNWCSLVSSGSTPPITGAYDGVNFGGDDMTGNFCFMLTRDGKTMWCMIDGCRKDGF